MSRLSQEQLSRILRSIGLLSPGLAAEIALRKFTSPQPIPRPEWEKELIARGEPMVFGNGTRGTVWGQKGAPVVLLVHGWQGRGTQLGKLVDPLVDRSFRVVAWDGPAHGESPGKRANLRLFAELMSEAAAESGKVRAVVAHSFGTGATTLALARGWLKAERVVLVAAPSDLVWVIDGFCRRFRLSPKVEAAFRHKLETWARLKVSEMRIAELAKTIDTPAMIVHDEHDEDVPFAEAQRIIQHWRGSRLVALTGVGHRKILKAPAFIEAVLVFVGDGAPGAV